VALAALYDRRAPIVLAVCQRVLGNRSDAEHVLEEVFFEIWQRADRYDPKRGSPIVYLVTLARSRAIDRKRRPDRRVTRLVPRESPSLGEAACPHDHAPPSGDDAAAKRARRVREALDSLASRERRAVELSFFEGWTQQEIARQMSEPLGSVESRVRRGLLQLRRVLGGPNDDMENT